MNWPNIELGAHCPVHHALSLAIASLVTLAITLLLLLGAPTGGPAGAQKDFFWALHPFGHSCFTDSLGSWLIVPGLARLPIPKTASHRINTIKNLLQSILGLLNTQIYLNIFKVFKCLFELLPPLCCPLSHIHIQPQLLTTCVSPCDGQRSHRDPLSLQKT